MHAPSRPRLDAARAHQRHRARGLPGAARSAQLRPGRPRAALPAARAAGRERAGGRPALARSAVRTRPTPRRAGRDRAGAARCSSWPTRSTPSWPRRRHPLLRDWSCRCCVVLANMETAGIAVDHDAPVRARGASSRRRSRRPPHDAYARDRQGDQPRLAQAAAGRAVRRARACPRPSAPRPATPPTPTRCRRLFEQTGHPFLSHLLVHRDATRLKVTVDGLLKSVADDGRIHTTYNQTIAATGRLSSPSRTCRTCRSARRRGGGSATRSSSADGGCDAS